MNSKKLAKWLRLTLLSLLPLALCSCVSIPNTKACSVAGVLSAGGICAETLTHKTSDMTFEEFLEFLEPQIERQDSLTGKTIPARAGAVCKSAADYNAEKTALEKACRMLGSRCSYDIKRALGK